MSELVDFLETLGRSSVAMRRDEYAEAVALFAPDVQAAIAARDSAALLRSVGGTVLMACSVVAPDFDEPSPDEQPATPDDVPGEDEVRAA